MMLRQFRPCNILRNVVKVPHRFLSAEVASCKQDIRQMVDEIPTIHPLLLTRAKLMETEFKDIEKTISSGKFDQDLTVKFSNLSVILDNYYKYNHDMSTIKELTEMAQNETDEELVEEIKSEITQTIPFLQKTVTVLQSRLLPPMKYSENATLLELRPGVGGSEASLFTEDLMQMYMNFANVNKWKYTLISKSEGSNGFVNEIIMSIDSLESFNILRHESGVHRVQRIPATESKGRIHTSTAAVVGLPKVSDGNESSLKEDERSFAPGEVRIDTMRAGGKGGQHVNTTDSAVRLVHIPTGITVCQQDERSQPKNKAKAFSILRSRLAALEREQEYEKQRKLRSDQVTTTDRSDKIRTYNYPQNRVTDHRAQFSLHDLQLCLDGTRLHEIIEKVEQVEFESRLQDLIDQQNSKS